MDESSSSSSDDNSEYAPPPPLIHRRRRMLVPVNSSLGGNAPPSIYATNITREICGNGASRLAAIAAATAAAEAASAASHKQPPVTVEDKSDEDIDQDEEEVNVRKRSADESTDSCSSRELTPPPQEVKLRRCRARGVLKTNIETNEKLMELIARTPKKLKKKRSRKSLNSELLENAAAELEPEILKNLIIVDYRTKNHMVWWPESETFAFVYAHMAAIAAVPESALMISNVKGSKVKRGETSASLKEYLNMTFDCVLIEQPMIQLYFQSNKSRSKRCYSVLPKESLRGTFELYASDIGEPVDCLRFRFDDEDLDWTKSANSQELEDDCVIDVLVKAQ